ncbi:MAG: phosphonate ABC transporter, permease protein PhnE [Candidatus Limiplasma sp.]|nr:phosphonate ABC transporter, permease protein PhnE [Candidatus Limiplasma sp.]
MAKPAKVHAVRTPLFDRLFPPRTMTVGERSVQKPRSRTWLIVLVLVGVVWGSVLVTEFDIGILIKRGYQFTVILKKVFNPDWSYISKVIPPLLDTIKMSVMGSAIGSTLALPFAVLASTNINRNGATVALLRVLLNIVRTLPTLVIASICALIFNLGTFAGTVAITIFTFGVVSKMLYESIETIDMGAFEAMEALGASRFQAFWSACMPQILPTYLSHCLYSFEINVRAASILGYVGAGGLGILINERVGWRDYEGLGTVLIALFLVVLLIENTSQYLRRKLS